MSAVTPTSLDRLGPLPRFRLTGEVLATYLRVRWSMRGDDAKLAVRALRGRARARRPVPGMDRGHQILAAWRLGRAMEKVLRRLPTDSRCLFSSLTLMCMLERRGIGQVVVIAARPQPFGAHAWVEVGGEAVLPAADPGYERLLEL